EFHRHRHIDRCLLHGLNQIEHVFERLRVEFRMLAGGSEVALEARQNDQLSSQRMASRPLRKRLPLPAVSSFNDSLNAALNSAIVRSRLARAAHAFRAASAFLLPV